MDTAADILNSNLSSQIRSLPIADSLECPILIGDVLFKDRRLFVLGERSRKADEYKAKCEEYLHQKPLRED